MPLPLILPALPPAPAVAEVTLVSAAGDRRQLAAPDTAAPKQLINSEIIPLTRASWLLPLAQASDSAPLRPSTQPADPETAPVEVIEEDENSEAAPPEDHFEHSPENNPAETEPDPPAATDSPLEGEGSIFLRADRQVFEPIRQIVTATGDVLIQFGTDQIAADRLWANLANRHVRAEGNVFFNRSNQIIEGDSLTYNLLQGAGDLVNARGDLQLSTLGDDLSAPFARAGDGRPLDYRLQNQGSISQVTSTGRIAVATGTTAGLLGGQPEEIRRLRFESDRLAFDAEGWYTDELRLTNDPFSPPELEFRASNVRLTPLNEIEDELVFDNPRLVFDQGLSIPLLRRRYVLQRGQLPDEELNPLPAGIGIDGRDRDGLFLEAEFPLPIDGPLNISVAPQFLVGRWLGSSNFNLADPANFGIAARIDGPLGPRTSVNGNVSLSGLDLENFEDQLRASFRGQQLLGNHRLSLEYVYRDRLFNGSLGFQDVQNSLGLLLESPNIVLGTTGLNLNYQVSGQYITANTDRPALLGPGVGVGPTDLARFQGSADLSRGFLLWQGEPLPATQAEGLRYSDRPLVPRLNLNVGMRGIVTYYSSNDLQEAIEGRITLSGQLGRLQRSTFDYTQFNIGFSHSFIGGDSSPFLFDRAVDQTVLSGGIVQQIYGPFLAGFQTALNLDTGRIIDTNLIFEYRRRAYGLLLNYSPTQQTGFLGFRISSFDWVGRTAPFDAPPDTPTDVIVQ
ncbi:MAG: DUF3769 domain-containing protein [Nodosilinea sp.]